MIPLQIVSVDSPSAVVRARLVTDAPISIRTASANEVDAIHELIDEHLADGHLLPREVDEIAVHAHRFIVGVQDDEVLAFHEAIPGHMKAMDMSFDVEDAKVLEGLKVGDQVVGKLTKENVILELRKP